MHLKKIFSQYACKRISIGIAAVFCFYVFSVWSRPNITVVIGAKPNCDGKDGQSVQIETVKLQTSRQNMSKCNHFYGKVTIFVGVEHVAYETQYKVALDSLRCYIASTDYELKIVDIFNDTRVAARCNHTSVFFRRHCAVATYINETDWMLVMDADTGIVNPNHCIEEYIDPRVEMVFYERFFNWEIASGNYLAKNTPFAKDFLMRWANYEYLEIGNGWWKGFDNGVLHIVFLESLFPMNSQEVKHCHDIWYMSKGYETYMPYVFCVRIYLGGTRIWPGKLKLLRRAHGFVRDASKTGDAWCEKDFMLHGWKANHVGDKGWKSPFEKDFDLSKCGQNYDGWAWRSDKRYSIDAIKKIFSDEEKLAVRRLPADSAVLPYLAHPDIALCYPECDALERVPGVS